MEHSDACTSYQVTRWNTKVECLGISHCNVVTLSSSIDYQRLVRADPLSIRPSSHELVSRGPPDGIISCPKKI